MSDPRAVLRQALREIEAGRGQDLHAEVRAGALTALGSKYLAVGSPVSIGLIHCGKAAAAMWACHEILFGALELRVAGDHDLKPQTPTLACGIEEAMACDIVCLPRAVDFELAWIAEGTHINLRNTTADASPGADLLLQSTDITIETIEMGPVSRMHGSLHDVISGKVSGRMSDEVTVLLHN